MTIYRSGITNDIVHYNNALGIVHRHSVTLDTLYTYNVIHGAIRMLHTAQRDMGVYKQYKRDPTSFVCRNIFNPDIAREAYEYHRNRP